MRAAIALGGTVLSLLAPATMAAIVDSGVVSLPVPATTAGLYVNVVTGAQSTTAASVPGWDINPFGSTLSFFSQNNPANISQMVGAGSTVAALIPGSTIGPASSYVNLGTTAGTAGTSFRTTGTSYLGFKFNNEGTATTNYGYAEISTNSPNGTPATVVRYVYENTGAPITITGPTQLFRAYLDPDGNDSNPCTLPAPCRLLPAALAAVTFGGEIWMLDSANYNTGPVNITKSVTILAVPGALGSVVASGGEAFVIATAGIKVVLRNLVIVPLPGMGGTRGINMTAGLALTLDNCLVANLPDNGVSVSGAASVWITNTTIRNNNIHGLVLSNGARATVARTRISGNAGVGVYILGTSAGTTTVADIADSTSDGNGYGVYAQSQNASAVVKASVRNSQLVRNNFYGAGAESSAGAVTLSVSGNIVSNNGTGVRGYLAAAKVWASGNTVSHNGFGLHNDTGALFESAGDNVVEDNGTQTVGVITPVARK